MDAETGMTIGELAARCGVTVKTVRFYADRGLLPQAPRSSGGHRRFGPEAAGRLRQVRDLRALGLAVPDVARVLVGGDDLEDLVADQLRAVTQHLAGLRWRQAALRSLADCTSAGERARRLRLLAAVQADGPPRVDDLVRFWRGILPAGMPAGLVRSVAEAAVPEPPAEPGPEQALAFAELVALARDGRVVRAARRDAARASDACDPVALYSGLAEAYPLAAAQVAAGVPPGPGEALDAFLAAHADGGGLRREAVAGELRARFRGTVDGMPYAQVATYWQLVERVGGRSRGGVSAGRAHAWLVSAVLALPPA